LERRGSRCPVVLVGALALIAWVGAAISIGAERLPARTVTVQVVAAEAIGGNEIWKVDIIRLLMDVNPLLVEVAGIKLKIESYSYWDPGRDGEGRVDARAGRTLKSLLPGMRRHLAASGRSGCDIVVGLIPEGPEGPVSPGIADYINGIVIIKYLKAKGGMAYVLLHEICHLFGAIDLQETGWVMSLRRPSFRIDGFTKAIMRVNRGRSFRPGESPLPEEHILEAIVLYEGRQALGLGEGQLLVCLGTLRAIKSAQR
jgi:hypothetical protein